MNTVYVIVRNVHGPAGHGEPPEEFIALGEDGGAWTLGNPYPVFTSKEKAEKFKETIQFGRYYKVIPLEVR